MMIKSKDVIFKLGHDLLNDLGTRSTGQIYQAESAFVYLFICIYRQQRDTPLTGEVVELRWHQCTFGNSPIDSKNIYKQ